MLRPSFSPFVFVLLMISASPSAHAADYAADDRRMSYEGRIAVDSSHHVHLGFPGITLRARVRGGDAQLKVEASSDTVYFNLSVDGGPPRRVRVPKGESMLALLPPGSTGDHSVELVRRTESWQGTCIFRGLVTSGATLLDPVPLPTRRMIFIGDSITCGEGTEPEADSDSRSPARANADASFGRRLARTFGAQCHLVSYGGRGIIRDWQGIRATNNAPQFYERALPDDPASRWDHASYVPDAIGICLGTNDFSQGVPDQNEFVNAYVEFVRKLQRDAPKAQIVLIDSPILNDGPGEIPKHSVCGAYLDEVVKAVGSPNVRHASVHHYKGAPDNAHPTAQDHAGIAAEIEPVFRAALTW